MARAGTTCTCSAAPVPSANNQQQPPVVEHVPSVGHYASSLFTLFNPQDTFLREVLLLLANEKTNAQRRGAKVQPTSVRLQKEHINSRIPFTY